MFLSFVFETNFIVKLCHNCYHMFLGKKKHQQLQNSSVFVTLLNSYLHFNICLVLLKIIALRYVM